MALYFIKIYPLDDQAALTWNITRKTWSKWIWITLDALYIHFQKNSFVYSYFYFFWFKLFLIYSKILNKKKKINWNERFWCWTNDKNYPVGVLDVTDFDVNCDIDPWNLWSWKHRRKVLKYELVLHMDKDLIIWCSGPWTGRTSDQGIFNLSLKKNLQEGEKLVSDCGYKGPNFVTPISNKKRKLDYNEKFHNWTCHTISARIEI